MLFVFSVGGLFSFSVVLIIEILVYSNEVVLQKSGITDS